MRDPSRRELGLSDTDQTCTTAANIAYIGECQFPKGGCEDPPAETGGETGGAETSDGTTGAVVAVAFGELDLHAEVAFARGEYLISDALIEAAIADPLGLALDGTTLELLVDTAGEGQGFELGGVERDNLGGVLGLRDGDVLLDIDGHATSSFDRLLDAATHALAQGHVTVLLLRDGEPISLRYRRM